MRIYTYGVHYVSTESIESLTDLAVTTGLLDRTNRSNYQGLDSSSVWFRSVGRLLAKTMNRRTGENEGGKMALEAEIIHQSAYSFSAQLKRSGNRDLLLIVFCFHANTILFLFAGHNLISNNAVKSVACLCLAV